MTKRMIYYDTETTGIRFNQDKIIELAAYDATLKKTFSSFINPNMPIPPEATQIHNITDEMVADAPSFEIVGKQFAEFCSGDVVLIAHNNDAFDKIFLETEYKNAGLEIPSWNYLDTLKWARKYRNDLPKHSLQFLREVYGIPANQAHRALDDVMVLFSVATYLFDDLDIEVIMELINAATTLERMPFGKHQGKPLSQVPGSYITWLHQSGAFDKPGNKELKDSLLKLGLLPSA